jgi:hypothetical protein
MNRFAELLPPPAGDEGEGEDGDDGRGSPGVGLAGALLLGGVGVPPPLTFPTATSFHC